MVSSESSLNASLVKVFASWKKDVDKVIVREQGCGALPISGFHHFASINSSTCYTMSEREISGMAHELLLSARIIVMTRQREYAIEKMEELITCHVSKTYYGIDEISPTELCHNAVEGFKFVRDMYKRLKSWRSKFDLLFAFTFIILEYGVDMVVREKSNDWNVTIQLLDDLSLMWNSMLQHTDDDLGIDPEFTRSGISVLLQRLQLIKN